MREQTDHGDLAPGEPGAHSVGAYLVGLALAVIMTLVSFLIAGTSVIWQEAVPAALIAMAIAQMGVHLVFFLHIDTGPDNLNNSLALLFGIVIVFLVVAGSVWIMGNLNATMMPPTMHMSMPK